MKLKNHFLSIITVSALIFSSCTSMADYDFSKIDSNLAAGNYPKVKEELEKSKTRIYSENDKLLALLDNGIINHFGGDFSESNSNLSEAEILMEKYSSINLLQGAASLVSNDLVMNYSGEDFEDIYTNIFMALNYLKLENFEDAMVEIRRFDNKLKSLKVKYEKLVKETNNSSSGTQVKTVSIKFSDSALARFLSLLIYRADGDMGNAEVDLKYIKNAFSTQSSIYNFQIPKCIDEELSVPRGMARLNVLSFYGKAPVKQEIITRLYDQRSAIWYKLALPQMVRRPSSINAINITARNISTGKTYSRNLEQLESIENIAEDTFQQHLSIISAKSIARAVSRAISNAALDISSEKTHRDGENELSALLTIIGMVSKIHTEIAERADVRCSRYFPGNAAITGITLEPGNYDISITYKSGNSIEKTERMSMKIHEKGLNLLETECLK